MNNNISQFINDFIDFPKKGIVFKDILPILQNPEIFKELIKSMSGSQMLKSADAIIAIDARGFIFGTAISIYLSKPMIVARKPGKLPGEILSKSYNLEYGQNTLSIQKEALNNFESFVIVDDLLATGGTVKCVAEMLKEANKKILGLSVVIELISLSGRSNFDFPVDSQIEF